MLSIAITTISIVEIEIERAPIVPSLRLGVIIRAEIKR